MKLGPGKQFGQWTLTGLKPLGRGGNGVVWAARNPDGREGAIKFLQSRHFRTPREKRFRDEILFLKGKTKEHGILPLIDFCLPAASSETSRPWFATPLAIPFNDLGLSGAANLPELVRLIAQVSQNLSSLHGESIWHRDLKPENLFLLDNIPLIGDFGLADFPDKDAITTKTEIMGPLFYVAPEMMGDTEQTSAGPADVYALAKTLWVLASGQRYPLQGEQRMDTPSLRLSTYCRHEHAQILDSLIQRSTAFEATKRPTMKEFSAELSEWLTIGVVSSPAPVDLSVVAKECEGVFEPGIIAEREQRALIKTAEAIVQSFDDTLERIRNEIYEVTKIPPTTGSARLYERFHFLQALGGPRLVWREARVVKITTKMDVTEVFFQGFVQVEALDDNRIRILVGYLSQPLIGGTAVLNQGIWTKETIAHVGSAALANGAEMLKVELINDLPQALREHVKKVKQYFQRR